MQCSRASFVDEDFDSLVKLISCAYKLKSPDCFDSAVELFSVLLDIFE